MAKKTKKKHATKDFKQSPVWQEYTELFDSLSTDEQFDQVVLLMEWFFGRSVGGAA